MTYLEECARLARAGYEPEWTGEQFAAWLKGMGWTDTKAEQMLGITRKTVASYRRKGPPRVVRYACLKREWEVVDAKYGVAA